MPVTQELGFWCHTEGIYFTSEDEHLTEEQWRKTELGSLGHYGYECAGQEETVRVAIVSLEQE